MSQVDKIMAELFDRPRDPRSDEYKAGVRATLRLYVDGVSVREQYRAAGYELGSAQADAFFAGVDEGHVAARERGLQLPFPRRGGAVA